MTLYQYAVDQVHRRRLDLLRFSIIIDIKLTLRYVSIIKNPIEYTLHVSIHLPLALTYPICW